MLTSQGNRQYEAPLVRIVPVRMEQCICSNPLPGGMEDIGYDDDF